MDLPIGKAFEPLVSPLEKAIMAGTEFLDADSEDDRAYEAALERFVEACADLARSRGWRPPSPGSAAGSKQAGAPFPGVTGR